MIGIIRLQLVGRRKHHVAVNTALLQRDVSFFTPCNLQTPCWFYRQPCQPLSFSSHSSFAGECECHVGFQATSSISSNVEGVAQQERVARRCLAEVRGDDILSEEVGCKAPANAKVREVVSETITAATIGHEEPIGREPPSKTIREKLEVGDARLSYREDRPAHEQTSPDISLQCCME